MIKTESERRIAQFLLSETLFKTSIGLPMGTKLFDISMHKYQSGTIVVTIEHETFSVIKEGVNIPLVNIVFDYTKDMTDTDYMKGRKQVAMNILRDCLGILSVSDPITKGAALVMERQKAVSLLRDICADHGDNDWSDDLHLADIIEKHLQPHLETD